MNFQLSDLDEQLVYISLTLCKHDIVFRFFLDYMKSFCPEPTVVACR